MPTKPCPYLAQIHALSQRDVSPSKIDELAGHITQCASCQETLHDSLVRLPRNCGRASKTTPRESGNEQRFPESVGPFHLLWTLGTGGMGQVYLAWHSLLRKLSVVKMIRSDRATNREHQDRFLLEMRSQAALSEKSENIMPVMNADVDSQSGALYMAMPYLPGLTLEQHLTTKNTLPVDQAVGLFEQLALGVCIAHREGIVHRDIKPSNIFLERRRDGESFRVRLFDFGLTKRRDATSGNTEPGTALGSPGYMSPEQLGGEEAGPEADLFSLGCTYYRVLTGKLPFPGLHRETQRFSWSEYRRQVMDVKFLPVSPRLENAEVSAELSALVLHLLAKHPGDRPRSAEAVHQRLVAMSAGANAGPTKSLDSPLPAPPEDEVTAQKPIPSPANRRLGCTITFTLSICIATIAIVAGLLQLDAQEKQKFVTKQQALEKAQAELADLRDLIKQKEQLIRTRQKNEAEQQKKWEAFMEETRKKMAELDTAFEKELASLQDEALKAKLREKARQEKELLVQQEREQAAKKAKTESELKAELDRLREELNGQHQKAHDTRVFVNQPPPVYYPPWHYRYYYGW